LDRLRSSGNGLEKARDYQEKEAGDCDIPTHAVFPLFIIRTLKPSAPEPHTA
jgi:hypothetical protein